MAKTDLQMNWAGVSFTPVAGVLTPFNKIDNVDIDWGATILSYSGDADRYSTTKVNSMNDPKVSIKGSNVALLQQFSPGTTGTFAATHKDAKQAVGGDIVYVMANCIIGTPTSSGGHAQFGTATLTIESFSLDGVTSPLLMTRA